MNLQDKLTKNELDKLEDFLLSDSTPENCMDISMLDGFLTCLAIGPELIPPSLWIPAVWEPFGGGEVVWEFEEEATYIFSLLVRYYNSIIDTFRKNPGSFSPIVHENTNGEVFIESWCIGFLRGIAFNTNKWDIMMDIPEEQINLLPILIHGTTEGWNALELKETKDISREEWLDLMIVSVGRIHEFWLPYRNEIQGKQPHRQAKQKTRRNDPCPCGSGKKFKHCCMK